MLKRRDVYSKEYKGVSIRFSLKFVRDISLVRWVYTICVCLKWIAVVSSYLEE